MAKTEKTESTEIMPPPVVPPSYTVVNDTDKSWYALSPAAVAAREASAQIAEQYYQSTKTLLEDRIADYEAAIAELQAEISAEGTTPETAAVLEANIAEYQAMIATTQQQLADLEATRS